MKTYFISSYIDHKSNIIQIDRKHFDFYNEIDEIFFQFQNIGNSTVLVSTPDLTINDLCILFARHDIKFKVLSYDEYLSLTFKLCTTIRLKGVFIISRIYTKKEKRAVDLTDKLQSLERAKLLGVDCDEEIEQTKEELAKEHEKLNHSTIDDLIKKK